MNILVIGNGFDIAHGLPTQYSYFLEYIQAINSYEISKSEGKLISENNKYQYFSSLYLERPVIYKELHTLIDNNKWIKYFLSIYKSRCEEGKTGWIDFESEISIIIRALDSAYKLLSEQFHVGKEEGTLEQWQLNMLCPILYPGKDIYKAEFSSFNTNFILNCKHMLLTDLNKLTRCLEIYLSDYISYETLPLFDIESLKIDKVLSFNYTKTYECLYAKKTNKSIDYDYIHGKADISKSVQDCNLVLGIDEYLNNGLENTDNEFIQFKKFYQRIYKMTGCHYKDWLDKKTRNGKEWLGETPPGLHIYIYGHSLDVTDKDILYDLITAEGAITTIFYHNKEALGKQIANLVKVIGEDDLIKRTDGRNRSIIFKQTSPETVA